MNAFLKWWIQIAIIVFAVVMVSDLGWWTFLYEADMTKISFVILSVFIVSSIAVGFISLQSTGWDHVERLTNYVWFSSEAMVTLGMIGTVAGFLIMLNTAFANLDVNNITNVQQAISDMSVGMSTALVTTLVGLVCSTVIKVQLVIYENA